MLERADVSEKEGEKNLREVSMRTFKNHTSRCVNLWSREMKVSERCSELQVHWSLLKT